MSQNQTQTYIPKFSYPFAQKDRKIYDDEIGKLPLGNYLFTQMGFWHGGIHFQGNDMLTNIKAEQGIKSIADGELVAYRINENYHDEGNGIYSTGFFLVRHKIEYPKDNKLTFFSLYMHTAKKDAYNIIQNQTNQSNTNYYTVKKGDTLGKIAKVHNTTVDKLRQDNNIADVNKIREGHVLIIKTFQSSQPTQNTPPAQNNPNSNPNFIVENPLFDKVVILPTPKKIKAGEYLGLMGEYNVKENSQDKCLHLEVFASKEFKTFVQTAKQGDNKLPQSFNWATIIDEQSSTDHISIFKNLEVVFKNSDETLRMNPMFNELFKLIDKGSQENGDGILHVEEISDSAKNPIIKKVTNNYIVKHSSEWDKTVNMADLLNDIVNKIDKSEFETKDEYKELLKKEKKRIEKLSFFAECKDKIEGFPKDDKVYVMNPVGLVNQFNKECGCERNFTVDDAKKALRVIYDTYGRDMAIIVEKMYRDETTHFTSKQYIRCGGAGMESFGSPPYYGWDSKLFKNPPICTWSAFENEGNSRNGGNPQVTDRKKVFMVFDTVLDAMTMKANYINKYNGNYARWHSTNKERQEAYHRVLEPIKAKFVSEFDGVKK